VGVDAQQLIVSLNRRSGPAAVCRDDLEHGARFVLLPGLVDAGELRAIYRLRAEHLAAQGADAISAFEAVELLEASEHTDLALGKVDGGPSGRIFQLFFDPLLEGVVACLTVPDRPVPQ
jgi:hypothetical protein